MDFIKVKEGSFFKSIWDNSIYMLSHIDAYGEYMMFEYDCSSGTFSKKLICGSITEYVMINEEEAKKHIIKMKLRG